MCKESGGDSVVVSPLGTCSVGLTCCYVTSSASSYLDDIISLTQREDQNKYKIQLIANNYLSTLCK